MRLGILLSCFLATLLLAGCLGSPEGVNAINDFEKRRYLGRWYEVARLDHSFERGLSNVTADYSLREDGGLKVINRGYSAEEDAWSEAEGKAYFIGDKQQGQLKVSFFGPFYGSYIIFEAGSFPENSSSEKASYKTLSADYQYSFVAGNSTDYLWLLARTPTISPLLREHFIQRVDKLGFDSQALIFVDQDLNAPPVAKELP